MKLTPRAQNGRYRRANWPETRYIDVTRVSMGFVKRVEGFDQNRRRVVFGTNEEDTGWVRMGSTVKLKRKN